MACWMVRKSPWPSGETVTRVEADAADLFAWAVVFVRSLASAADGRARERDKNIRRTERGQRTGRWVVGIALGLRAEYSSSCSQDKVLSSKMFACFL